MTKLESAIALAAQGFFVFPITPGAKQPPLIHDFPHNASRLPGVIADWWATWPEANIGISTSAFGEGDALLVVDVDTKKGKRGDATLLSHELDGRELPDTFTQHTPSGGRHLVYRVPSPVRQGTDVLGCGVDVRSKGGYVLGIGSSISDGVYQGLLAPLAAAPDWLVERCGARSRQSDGKSVGSVGVPVDAGRAVDAATRYLRDDAPVAVEGQGGDETTYKVAARVKDFGVDELDTVSILLTHWNDRCSPPWVGEELARKVHNAYAYGQEPRGVAAPEADFATPFTDSDPTPPANTQNPYEKLNQEYAFVLAGGGAHILWETVDATDRYRLEHLTMGAFHAKFAPQKMLVGRSEKPLSQLWIEWRQRREYDGLVFLPEQTAPPRFYNLWRGFAVEPAEQAEPHAAVEAFLDHARTNVCDGHEALFRWLIGYFAHLIQRPWEKPLVALVFRGGKGVGKNALIERIGALLGGHYLLTSNRRYLTGNFNGHLENCLLFALDEAFWSGDKQAEGTLKDLITGREHVIEHKGKEPYTVANKTRVVIIGNEEWLVPASHDERRFAVFDVGEGRKQDRAYFQAMREGLEQGGYRHLLRFLLDYDLSGIDLNAAPSTQGLIEQKQYTLAPLQQWWLDCLENGTVVGSEFPGWPEEVDCERFRSALRRYVKERNIGSRLPDDRTIGRLLKKCAPGVVKRRLSKRDDGGQPYVYTIPALGEARLAWGDFIGHPTAWADDNGA